MLGIAAFATVAPLQLRRPSLASSLNIAAFNFGNALGAWVGGVVIERGRGLGGLGWAAALLAGLAIALWSRKFDRRDAIPADCAPART